MPYFMLEDFASGIDLRKSEVTAKPGSLRQLENAFVNAGGEIEKRKKFSLVGSVAGTVGLSGSGSNPLVFSAYATFPVGSPFVCRPLVPRDAGLTIKRILDTDTYRDQEYVIARWSDNSIRHHYKTPDDPSTTSVDETVIGAEHDTKQRTVTSAPPPPFTTISTPSTSRSAKVHKQKVYLADGDIVRFSAINEPHRFYDILDYTHNPPDPIAGKEAVGAGFIDVTAEDTGRPEVIGLETYYRYLAMFGRRSIQIWSMDPDPSLNQLIQIMGNTGLLAPYAVARYGSGDVLFLSDTGIRSVRARDSSNAAILNDIGSPIDNIIQDRRKTLSDVMEPSGSSESERIKALVDPLSGHFWLVWGSTVYVMSYYPATKVTAWSRFILPWVPDYVAQVGARLCFRVGDNVYVYGDWDGLPSRYTDMQPVTHSDPDVIPPGVHDYDDTVVTVETPMLDFGKPAHWKQYMGIDAAVEGNWTVYVNYDPLAPGAWVVACTINQPTFSLARIPLAGSGTHIGIRMVSSGTGRARIGSFAIHHNIGEAD